ncbi:MAG TPA: MFS transporter [Candidatus Polarisedimenticolaceae bacterium]|nr:MFS transporter [Candidatus Polarisedimenticolaceae bacterium]
MSGPAKRAAFRFVLTMGIVNLFADTTYEGGASINGPFLGSLGATAATVGMVAGCGEFLGYTLRSISGYVADRTGRFWPITFVGYTINLLAVPAMALAGRWETAATFLILERVGRAFRKPTVEAMLSYSAGTLGRGWVYGLNTALDETGATLGPLLIAFALHRGASYRTGYAWLIVSSLCALAALTVARTTFPVPAKLEEGAPKLAAPSRFTPRFWISMVGAACFGAGLMSFELISFHLASHGGLCPALIPVALALATVAGIAASLALGRLYDRVGLPVVLAAMAAAAMFSPLVFLGGRVALLGGMALWGLGYAVQDSLLKAVVAGMLPEGKRSLAFGLFYSGYGVGWLVGGIATGALYTRSLRGLVVFSVVSQLAAIPLFLFASRREAS